MTTGIERLILQPVSGFASETVALHVAQLDELTAYLWNDLADAGAAELAWSPGPGHNTIGMLLAHVALVEVFWVQTGMLGMDREDVSAVLGIGMDDDGMPLPPGGAPPAGLAGRDLAWYRGLLERARRHTHDRLRDVRDGDLATVHGRTRRNGERQEYNRRWVLFHMVEHLAGHYGQVLLIRHRYRDRGAGA